MVNKVELVKAIATEMGESFSKTEKFLDAFKAVIETALVNGDGVNIQGIGQFEIKTRDEKIALNPRTQEKVKVPSHKAVNFKVSQTLKEKVR
jgi:nucleoid DNA-binding protein